MGIAILLTLLKYWVANEPVLIEEVAIPLADLNPAVELLVPEAAAVAMRKVSIAFDAKGKVSAASGDEKLGAFDPAQAGKMKPLDDWLTKLGKKEKLRVAVRVHKDTKMQGVTDLLNVFAKQGISEITFTDLNEE